MPAGACRQSPAAGGGYASLPGRPSWTRRGPAPQPATVSAIARSSVARAGSAVPKT